MSCSIRMGKTVPSVSFGLDFSMLMLVWYRVSFSPKLSKLNVQKPCSMREYEQEVTEPLLALRYGLC